MLQTQGTVESRRSIDCFQQKKPEWKLHIFSLLLRDPEICDTRGFSERPCRATPGSGLFAHRVGRIIPRVFFTSYRLRIQLPLSLWMHPAVQTGSAELVRALSFSRWGSLNAQQRPAPSVHTTLRSSLRRVSLWSGMAHVSFIFYMGCLREQTLLL